MTLVSLPAPITHPGIALNPFGVPALATSVTVTSAGHYQAYVFSAREDMTITHLGFMPGTAAGSPTIDCRVETVATTGLPSGTLWNLNGTGAAPNGVTGAVTSSTWVLQALTNSAIILKGQTFCVKFALATGTSLQISHMGNLNQTTGRTLPYQVTNTGTPTAGMIANLPLVALGSSSTTFYSMPGVMALNAYFAGAFNSTNNTSRGLKFTPNFNCRAIGARWYKFTSAGDYNLMLMDSAGAELSSSSTAFDGDHSSNGNNGFAEAYFDNVVTLTAGTTYRLGLVPASGTNINLSVVQFPTVDYFSSSPCVAAATATYFTQATGAGAFTDSTTQIPLLDVLLDQVDNGAGSGGVVGVIGG